MTSSRATWPRAWGQRSLGTPRCPGGVASAHSWPVVRCRWQVGAPVLCRGSRGGGDGAATRRARAGPPPFNFHSLLCLSHSYTNHFCGLCNNLWPGPRRVVNIYLHIGAKVAALSHGESQGSGITLQDLEKGHRKVRLFKSGWVILPGPECQFTEFSLVADYR